MDEVVSEGHLVLLFGFVQITIKHLQNGVLRIDFSVMVLLVDLNLLFERFCFRETEPFTPLRQDFHTIEMGKSLLFHHLSLEIVSSHAHHLLLFLEVFVGLLLVADANHLALGLLSHDLSFDKLAELNHFLRYLITLTIS